MLQQLEDRLLHLPRGEALRKMLLELIAGAGDSIDFFLLLGHDCVHHIFRELALLAVSLGALSLREGRGCFLCRHDT